MPANPSIHKILGVDWKCSLTEICIEVVQDVMYLWSVDHLSIFLASI